jgi:hypothetical protein
MQNVSECVLCIYCTPWLQVWEEQVVPEAVLALCQWRQTYLSQALTTTPRESKELTVTTAGAALLEGAVHKFVFAWHLPAADVHTLKTEKRLYSPSHYYAGQARVHMIMRKIKLFLTALPMPTGSWGMCRVSCL